MRSKEYLALVWSNDCQYRRIYAALVRGYIFLCNCWSNSESACFKRSSASTQTGGSLRVGVCTDLQGWQTACLSFSCSDIIKSQDIFAWVHFLAMIRAIEIADRKIVTWSCVYVYMVVCSCACAPNCFFVWRSL